MRSSDPHHRDQPPLPKGPDSPRYVIRDPQPPRFSWGVPAIASTAALALGLVLESLAVGLVIFCSAGVALGIGRWYLSRDSD